MSRKHSKSIRKPMPKPTEVHGSMAERVFNSYTNEQVREAIEDWQAHNPEKYVDKGESVGYFHADPADEHGWDWAAPSERDQRLWETK